MKRFILLMLLIVSLTVFISCNKKDSENDSKENISESVDELNIDIEKTAIEFVQDLVNDKYDDAYNNYNFTVAMKNAINPDELKRIMDEFRKAYGEFVKIIDTNESKKGAFDIIAVTCEFEKSNMNLNVVFDSDKKITGFHYTNAENTKESDTSNEKMPSNIEEVEVTVGEGEWKLPGTLTRPKGKGPFPVVVLIHGSGPNDRDETVGPNKPFRDIAWGLASKEIAVLRYEKRTKEHMNKMMPIMNEITVKEEIIDDALSAIKLLRSNEKIDKKRIYMLGHSLGGYTLPRIGVKDKDIAGFIILAGSTRPMEDLIVEQMEYIYSLDGNLSEDEKSTIKTLKAAQIKIKSPELNENTDSKELMGINAKYWLDLRNYNPTELVKELKRPILVLQGERDYQVTMVDFNNWKEALKDNVNSSFISYEKLNHIFMTGEGKATPTEYYEKGNVSKEVIEDISNWINK